MAESRVVHCIKLNRKMPGLSKPPIPGTLGQKIYEEVSQEGWEMFKKHFTRVINEMKLNLMSPESDKIFKEQIEAYFWGIEPPPPPEFIPHKH